MKIRIAAVIALISLAACSGQPSGHQALIDACMSTGDDSREACACLADKLEADLSPKVYEAVVAAARATDDDAAAKLIEQLAPLDQMSLGVTMLDAAGTCKASLF